MMQVAENTNIYSKKEEVKKMKKTYAKGYELGTVRAIFKDKEHCPEIKLYDSPKEMIDDIQDDIQITVIKKNMCIVSGKTAEQRGEPCGYEFHFETPDGEADVRKFYGNIIIVGFDTEINAYLSLDDEQMAEFLNDWVEIRTLCITESGCVIPYTFKNMCAVFDVLGDHVIHTDISYGICMLSQEENVYDPCNVCTGNNSGSLAFNVMPAIKQVILGYEESRNKYHGLTDEQLEHIHIYLE